VDLQLQNISTQSYNQTIILLSRSTIKLLSIRVLPLTRRKNGGVSHLHHLLLPLSLFFRIIMTFSTEFQCYIDSHILASWGTTLAGLLPSWPTVLGHNAVAHDAMFLTLWVTALCPSHATGPLLAAPTAVGHDAMSLTRAPRRQMYSFVKFRSDNIFLQNIDKNILKNYSLSIPPPRSPRNGKGSIIWAATAGRTSWTQITLGLKSEQARYWSGVYLGPT
jgi:hypothetical protein